MVFYKSDIIHIGKEQIAMLEKYETPEVEFVEMEEEDVIVASGTGQCTGGRGGIEVND